MPPVRKWTDSQAMNASSVNRRRRTQPVGSLSIFWVANHFQTCSESVSPFVLFSRALPSIATKAASQAIHAQVHPVSATSQVHRALQRAAR